MNIYLPPKYGFVYIWRDRKHNRYYIGSHWGDINDGYVCSSNWMHNTHKRRKEDFKRRIISYVFTNRKDLLAEEEYWLSMIKDQELATKNSTVEKRKTLRYYNFTKSTTNPWHSTPEGVAGIGAKISKSKTGKSNPCSPEKAKAISEAKKIKFKERGGMSDEHKIALTGIKKPPHTDEWKQQNSERLKKQWADGTRKRSEPKNKMKREDQDKLSSEQLKARWSDPIWAENQRQKLKDAWIKRKLNINRII
jgi:hypothetical protein